MEESQQPSARSKWPGKLALLFAILFAIFWSLGDFFFWTFLMLALYFAFLDFYYSDTLRRWMEGLDSIFQPKASQPDQNPYQAFRTRTSPPPETPQNKNRLIVRVVLLGFVFFVFFTFLVGLFSSVEDSTATESTSTDSAIEEVPSNDDNNGTTFLNEKGNAAMQNEKMDSAIYYYDQALLIDPENMYALYNKGLVYTLRQEYQKGNSLGRRCLAFHPDYNPAWWLLGYNYDQLNNTDSALYCLEQAFQNEYYQPEFLTLLSEVYMKKNKRTEALGVYQKMVELDTTRADIFRKMAELDPSNSEKYMQKVRALGN